MKKYCIMLLLIIIVLSVFSAANYASSEGKVYKWRIVDHTVAGTVKHENTVRFCERVKEVSNGRLIIEPYAGGVLFPVFDTFEAVQNDIVEMSAVYGGYWAGVNPFFAITGNQPGSPIQDFAECAYCEEEVVPLKQKVYAKYGITYLGPFSWTEAEYMMSNVPIRKVEDFKGLKVRTSGPGAHVFKALGASVVSASAPEIYNLLKLGTVDVAEYDSYDENSRLGLNEVTKYAILLSFHTGACEAQALCVNPKEWDKLPDDLKAIVMSCRGDIMYDFAWRLKSANCKAKVKYWDKGNIEYITFPEEELEKGRKVGLDVMRWYAKQNPECAEYVAIRARTLYELGYKDEAKYLGYNE